MTAFALGSPSATQVTDAASGTVTTVSGTPFVGFGALAGAVAAGLVTDADVFYAPAIGTGVAAQTLLPDAVADTETVYAPSLAAIGSLLPGSLADTETIYAPTIVAAAATQTLLPARVTDADVVYAAAAIQGRFLRPTLVIDAEAVYPAFDIDTAKPPKSQTLRPGRLNSDDVFFSPRFSILPQLVVAADVVYAPILIWENPVRPPMVASDDAIQAAAIAPKLPSSFIPADDAIYSPGISLFLVPQLLPGDDAVAAADVGWKVFAEITSDLDEVFPVGVSAHNNVLPDVWLDEENVEGYPFFIQGIEGGIPVPAPPWTLTGSIRGPRRLTGSLGRKIQLTGSLSNKKRQRR